MKGWGKALLIACVAIAGLFVVGALRSGGSELTFYAPAQERAEVDVDPSGPSLGDMTVISGELEDDDGEAAGRHDGVCTVTSAADSADERRHRCAVTLTVGTDNGETELQLAAVGRAAADDVIFSVVGGSGKYQDAGGEAVFDYTDRERTKISVELDD